MKFRSFAVIFFLGVTSGFAQLVIQNVTYPTGQAVMVTNNSTITAQTNVVVPVAADVTYVAGGVISLEPGFHAQGYFHAVAGAALVNPTADNNGDGIPDGVEQDLGLNLSQRQTVDSSNTNVQLHVHTPAKPTN